MPFDHYVKQTKSTTENANSSYCMRGRLTQCCQTLAQHFRLTDAQILCKNKDKKMLKVII